MSSGLEIDLTGVPWSRRGSYVALSMNTAGRDHPGRDRTAEPGLYVHDVSGYRLWRWNGVFRVLGLVDGHPAPLEVLSATPELLRLQAGDGQVDMTWDGEDTLRVRCLGVGIRVELSARDPLDAATTFATAPQEWRLQLGEDAHWAVTRLAGALTASEGGRVFDLDAGDDVAGELALTQYESSYLPPESWTTFDACVEQVEEDLALWCCQDGLPVEVTDALARYLLWSCTVGPRGALSSRAVLMSKNWMHAVWSWDHCFTAIGLAGLDPALAWEQYLLPFEHQSADGALPDIVHDAGTARGFVKPPVHGWALRRLLREMDVSDDQLRGVYPRLVAWTEWWFRYRDTDGDGLPEYFHGCDSGQDNSTAFDAVGYPAAAPDLAAFLVVQLDVLADIARRLSDPAEAQWRAKADQLLGLLLERLWDGRRFRLASGGAALPEAGRSQLTLLPLVLGDRLPVEVREALVDDLTSGGLLTAYGVASESPHSPLYEPDGYWRGPVWAPTTYLVVDGLRSSGRPDLAGDVAEAYLSGTRENGFAENWDATTGAPLRDRGYTWGAAVHLALTRELADGSSWFAEAPEQVIRP